MFVVVVVGVADVGRIGRAELIFAKLSAIKFATWLACFCIIYSDFSWVYCLFSTGFIIEEGPSCFCLILGVVVDLLFNKFCFELIF